jgi:hypothetical protein
MLSIARSVSKVQPESIKLWILGACVVMPSMASSVILQFVRSSTRKFSAVCRRIRGGNVSSQVIGLGGRGFSLPVSVKSSAPNGDGNALSVSNEQCASRRVRSFLHIIRYLHLLLSVKTYLENDHTSLTDTGVNRGKSHNSNSTSREQVLAIADTEGSVIPVTPLSWIQ